MTVKELKAILTKCNENSQILVRVQGVGMADLKTLEAVGEWVDIGGDWVYIIRHGEDSDIELDEC